MFDFEEFFVILHAQNRQGEMAEWSKAHAWKVCKRRKRFKGSNPFLSAFFSMFIINKIRKEK